MSTSRPHPVLLLLLLAGACGGRVELELPPEGVPLFVVDTFPASGATVEPAHLSRISVTFDADLGEDAPQNPKILDKIRLQRRPAGEDAFDPNPVDLGLPGYHKPTHTLEFNTELGGVGEAATAGVHFRLTIGKGLEAKAGRSLAADVHSLFWVGGEAPGAGN
jgi:hypothetical protein